MGVHVYFYTEAGKHLHCKFNALRRGVYHKEGGGRRREWVAKNAFTAKLTVAEARQHQKGGRYTDHTFTAN